MKLYLELTFIVFLLLLNIAVLVAPIIMVAVLGFNPLWLLMILALCFTIPMTAIYLCRWL